MFDISRQAYIYGIVSIITSIINLILFSVLSGVNGFIFYLVFFIIGIPFLFLYIYGIHCLTTGGCNIFSWVVSILAIIYMIVTTIIIIAYTSLKDKSKL
jgi:hypothetical protein